MSLKSPTLAWQSGFLFAIDTFTNVIDYGFHLFLGRVLRPADFAIVQTLNAILLIIITTFGLLQPVVARYVVEMMALGQPEQVGGIFRHYFRLAAGWGIILMVLAWMGRAALADWLGVPMPAVALSATMLLLALLRPVTTGILQGQQNFILLGLSRTVFAISRFALGFLLLHFWPKYQLLAIISAWPIGLALSLVTGLLFTGWRKWQPPKKLSLHFRQQAGWLSLAAFMAYASFMSLQSLDLIWVNRLFGDGVASSYATAVLLRRALSLLPGAVIAVMYPQAVAQVAGRQKPDRLLIRAALLITLPTLLVTGLYHLAGEWLIRLTFGPLYSEAATWLGWMGLAMVGYGLASVWLNFYLATRPEPFVLLLVFTAGLQFLTLSQYHATLNQILIIFGAAGWFLALAGLLLYLGWFRKLVQAPKSSPFLEE